MYHQTAENGDLFNSNLLQEQIKIMQQVLSMPQHTLVGRRGSSPLAPTLNLDINLNAHRRIDRSCSEGMQQPQQQQQLQQANLNSSRYKTELCRPFEESGVCNYGDKCQFAHGLHELRSLTRHPKYKTELCRTFHNTAYCPYGLRCHFVHNADERVRYSSTSSAASSPISTSPTSQTSFFSEGSLSPASDSARTSPSPSFHLFNTGFPTLAFEQFRPTAI